MRSTIRPTDTRPTVSQPEGDISATRQELERALDLVARSASDPGGEVYLPLFERLEMEIFALESQESALDRARLRAKRAA